MAVKLTTIQGAAPSKLAITVPELFRQLLGAPLFPCSSIDWTTVHCIHWVPPSSPLSIQFLLSLSKMNSFTWEPNTLDSASSPEKVGGGDGGRGGGGAGVDKRNVSIPVTTSTTSYFLLLAWLSVYSAADSLRVFFSLSSSAQITVVIFSRFSWSLTDPV